MRTTTQQQAVLPQDQLLPVRPHLREGHQRLDDSGCLGARGSGRYWAVQGSNRVLQRQQGAIRGGQPGNRTVESLESDMWASLEGRQRLVQGRNAEQGACTTAARDSAGTEAPDSTASSALHHTSVRHHPHGQAAGIRNQPDTDLRDLTVQIQGTEDKMEAMHRRCVQAATHRKCVRVASSRKNPRIQDLLPD